MGSKTTTEIVNDFAHVYYNSKVWTRTRWRGLAVGKCPLDLWVFQEIIYDTKPTLFIESGTGGGGTTWFIANIFDLIGAGRVITIDNKIVREEQRKRNPPVCPLHPRITYLLGDSSTSEKVQTKLEGLILEEDRVMVNLDSHHSRDHVSRELELFSRFVTPGCYLIVDDTNLGHRAGLGPKAFWNNGPWEAVQDFLKSHDNFVSDRKREKFFHTFNPQGYLLRIE